MKSLTTFVLLVCLLGAAVSASCPTFYTGSNQRGDSFELCTSADVPNKFDNNVLSFTVPRGFQVTLHSDKGFAGEFWGAYNPGSYNVPRSFEGKLSSVAVFGSYDSNPKCPVFYSDYGLTGSSFQQCKSGNVPSNFNDVISSFVVPKGFSVTLYSDYNKGGQTKGPYVDNPWNVPASFNDQTSYIEITNYADNSSDGLDDLDCPTFYTNKDQNGRSFELCSSGDVPNRFDNSVSSFAIPPGYTVTLYPGSNFGGDYWGPYTEGYYNSPDGLNDRLSSAKIQKNRRNRD